jgi:hypothetical protein
MKTVLKPDGEPVRIFEKDPVGFLLDILQLRAELLKMAIETIKHHNKPT